MHRRGLRLRSRRATRLGIVSARPLIVLVTCSLLLTACRRDDPEGSPPPRASVSVHPSTSAAPSASASAAKPAVPTITPEARRAYARHLAKGRALAGEQKWGEASVELEKALASVPGDPRALTELGFTQLRAGDVPKARVTSRKAVARAQEPTMKAQALYNLGRAEEASGHRDEAAKAYGASLALRPNDTVKKQLDGLSKTGPASASASAAAAPPPLPCVAPLPLDELIACIGSAARVVEEGEPSDPRPPTLLPIEGDIKPISRRVRVVQAPTTAFEDEFFLVASEVRGWTVVARLGSTFNPGAFGIHEDFEITKAEVRRVKDQSVLWLEATRSRGDSDMGIDEMESSDRREVTLCLLADEKRQKTSCPIARPLSSSYKRELMGIGEVDEETKKLQTPGLPIVRETTFSVTLDADGNVVTKLVKGTADDADRKRLGTAKLL